MLALPFPARRAADDTRPTLRRRALAIGLTLLAELLFLLILLALNPDIVPKADEARSPVLIDIAPAAAPKPAASAPRQPAKAAVRVHAPLRAQPPPRLYPHLTPSFVPMTRTDMAAADISKLGSNAPGASTQTAAKGQGPGEGPGGAQLFNAEWYVKPTHAQLAGYVTRDIPPGSWGEIACRTIDHYRVEDCRQLGESPGSGLARTMRLAAWQFLIRPPRIDGKPLIGSWVRIHYDIVAAGADN